MAGIQYDDRLAAVPFPMLLQVLSPDVRSVENVEFALAEVFP
jgi:hypothetical protein